MSLSLLSFRTFPAPLGEPTVDEHARAAAELLFQRFCAPAEDDHVDETDLFFGFVLTAAFMRHREWKFANGQALGSVAEIGIAGQVAQEDNLVVLRHRARDPVTRLALRTGLRLL